VISTLGAFMTKEVRHILRDRQTLTVLLLMPLVQVVLFGYALRSDVRDVRLAIVDPSPDYASLALRERFEAAKRFRIVANVSSMDDVEPLFKRGLTDLAVSFDPEFAQHLQSREPARVLIAVDASDPNTGSTMQAYARAVITAYEQELGAKGEKQPVRITPEVRMRFNPTLESVNLFIPGLIALVLTLVSALMTAISLSREKERGTLEILLVSPLRPWQIIVGKVLPYLGLAFANVLTALLAAWLIFRVPFRGSVTLLLVESILYSMVSLGLGVLVASVTSSQRVAMLVALLATMLPSTLLSGMVFPLASMPAILQVLCNIVPAHWFIVIARGIMLKGIGLEHLWRETLVLLAMMLFFMTAAVKSFKARVA
jgi:ABC-2 type transport system permease protein